MPHSAVISMVVLQTSLAAPGLVAGRRGAGARWYVSRERRIWRVDMHEDRRSIHYGNARARLLVEAETERRSLELIGNTADDR